MKSLRIVIVILSVSSFAAAGDSEFRAVVHALEGHYGVHHSHVPLLGFAMWFARPEGISGVKLAMFENLHAPTGSADVSRLVENSLGPDWHPFVRVRTGNGGHSEGDSNNENAEITLIYVSPSSGKLRMMIVNVGSSEAQVVEVKLSEQAIKSWLKDPGEKAEDQTARHQPGY